MPDRVIRTVECSQPRDLSGVESQKERGSGGKGVMCCKERPMAGEHGYFLVCWQQSRMNKVIAGKFAGHTAAQQYVQGEMTSTTDEFEAG